MNKVSVRFFNGKEVRSVWDDQNSRWLFSVIDVIGVLNEEDDYEKNRNYWKYLKSKLKKQNNQLGSVTTHFKLLAPDGKKHLSNVISYDEVIELVANFPNNKSVAFLKWFTENGIDAKSKSKAYSLFESSLLDSIEVGTVKGLQQIHAYLFEGLYDFSGKIRTVNISKGGFSFAQVMFLEKTLSEIEKMPDSTFEQIVDKYVEMNIAHPFREGNGRATRIWLDLLLKRALKKCVDWSKIDKKDYLLAMEKSVYDSFEITKLLEKALTNKIHDREIFIKGIDYSYYYEEP